MLTQASTAPALVHTLPLLDELLDAHAVAIGPDRVAYRNHAYRVVNWCAALRGPAAVEARGSAPAQDLEKIAIAAALHDVGIWTAKTFDYLPPSIQLAHDYLAGSARVGWSAEIEEMIAQHHKLRRYRAPEGGLVEAFRRADLVDVSLGWLRHGIARGFMREVWAAFPRAGFHGRLVQFTCQRFLRHPLSPLPMLRW